MPSHHTSRTTIVAVAMLLALLAATGQTALAHGETTVGPYSLEIGFHNEPVIVGEPNGLDLFVTNTQSQERVNGLDQTLKAELIFGASKKELAIEPQEGEDGAYTAMVIPTREGDYTWHIFGSIEGTAVDVSMTSSPDTFGSAEPRSTVEFPAGGSAVSPALVLGIAGTVLGALGLIAGLVALLSRRRAAVR